MKNTCTELCLIDEAENERGMATAEYAIGTVTATGIAGILWWVVNQDWFRDGLVSIFQKVFKLPGA